MGDHNERPTGLHQFWQQLIIELASEFGVLFSRPFVKQQDRALLKQISSSLTQACFLLACLTGMESPINAERLLMTPTANDRGGSLSRTRREVGFLLPISKDEAYFEKRFSGFAFGR
jgi:hypothetical protein